MSASDSSPLPSLERLRTVYPEAGHDVWDQAFAEPQLPRWILAQSRRPQ
jgi:hypothetical protein